MLFDGHDLSKWTGDHFDEWTLKDGVVTTGARVYNFLRTKASYGTSANAVKIHGWVAIRVYVLVAIVKKRLGLSQSLYTVLQVLSVTLFEKVPIQQALALMPDTTSDGEGCNPLLLFDR